MLKRVGLNISTIPARYIGGAQSQPRAMWSRTDRLNQTHGVSSQLSGVPSGHLHPSSWVLPLKSGAISSRNEVNIIFSGSGFGAQGINAIGSSAIVFSSIADGLAIASAIGFSTITFSALALGVAPLNTTGTSTIIFNSSGILNAPANLQGISNILFSASAQTFANGFMVAVPISQELTPDRIANAVWSALSVANDLAGSMGEKLNDAGSASNPWNEVIEGSYTAADMLRIVSAVMAGKTEINGTTVVFRDITDNRNAVTAEMIGSVRDNITYDP